MSFIKSSTPMENSSVAGIDTRTSLTDKTSNVSLSLWSLFSFSESKLLEANNVQPREANRKSTGYQGRGDLWNREPALDILYYCMHVSGLCNASVTKETLNS